MFDVKIKTNGILLRQPEADRLRDAGVREVQLSVYSHRADVHDAITKVPGSFERTIEAIRLLRARDIRVLVANVLMTSNAFDYAGVQALARSLGAEATVDPTITPMMNGDTGVLSLRVEAPKLLQIFRDRSLVPDDFCAPPSSAAPDAGHPRRHALQRRPHRLLRLAVRRGVSLRAVSPGDRQPAHPAVRRHLAPLAAAGRGAGHPGEGPADLLAVRIRLELHPVSRAGVHGRQHARTVFGRL